MPTVARDSIEPVANIDVAIRLRTEGCKMKSSIAANAAIASATPQMIASSYTLAWLARYTRLEPPASTKVNKATPIHSA